MFYFKLEVIFLLFLPKIVRYMYILRHQNKYEEIESKTRETKIYSSFKKSQALFNTLH